MNDPPSSTTATPPPAPEAETQASAPVPDPSAFPVKVRIKGQPDGPVFQGQTIIVPCLNCGRK